MKLKTVIILVLVLPFMGCGKKRTNTDLYEASTGSDLSFYRNKDTIYEPAGGSPHGNFRLKFNGTAKGSLDASGKLAPGGKFPDGALIVKEIYTGSEITLYAVMKKDSKSKFSASGWLWAEYEPGGKTVYDVTREGESCVPCHTSSDKDFTRSFDLH